MKPLRICFVVSELLGLERNGGIGTAITHMSMVLAGHGHEVDVLHCGYRLDLDNEWAARYVAAGVRVRILDRSVNVQPESTAMSWWAYQDLKSEAYDAIVFQDWLGLGAISTMAKHVGSAFANTTLIHHVHGPTTWLLEANRSVELDGAEATLIHMERTSARLADAVVSPSRYLLEWLVDRGWELPDRRYVIPAFTAAHTVDLRAPLAADRPASPLVELVFFGRLEERKGVRLFVDALNRLGAGRLEGIDVTFLGRPAHFRPDDVRVWLRAEVRKSLGSFEFLTDLDQPEALAYLRQPGRLAVMPSLVDNSPNVVYECIEERVPFLAGSTGGVGELVDPQDRSVTLFEPTAAALADRLGPLVDQRLTPRPARPAFDGGRALAAWTEVFESAEPRVVPRETPLVSVVVPTHDRPGFLRQAVDSLLRQTYSNMEVIVVDDGSTQPSAHAELDRLERTVSNTQLTVVRQENAYLGAARNAGARAGRGDYIAFLDDDDLAGSHYVSSLVRAMLLTDADAVSCAFETIDGSHDDLPRAQDSIGVWVFLGGPVAYAPFLNVLGGAGMLVRRQMFEKVGGFHERYGVGFEDYQFLAKVAMADGRIVAVPDPIYRYRYRAGSMMRSTNSYENVKVVNETFLDVLPDELRDWPTLLRGFHERILRTDPDMNRLYRRVEHLERELDLRQRYIELLERARGRS